MACRNALSSFVMAAGILLLAADDALSVDPVKRPGTSNNVVPQPEDALFPPSSGTPAGTFGGGAFDPFAPVTPSGTFNPTQPNTSAPEVTPRLAPQPQPDPSAEPPRWRLGVFSMDIDTGVRVVKVVQGSPAAHAGLEEDDLIVSVSGQQVGYIDGYRYELGLAFNEKADSDGHVLMLVQDHRTKNLVNLPVQLDSRFERVQGTITYRDRTRLPRGAQVNVELREIVRQGGPIIPIVTKTIDDPPAVPIPFVLEYDPSIIDPRREYDVHATIVSDGRPLYTTRTPYRVITDGAPRTADLMVYSVSSQYNMNGYASSREEEIERLYEMFREYLNRDPRQQEASVYTSDLDRGESLMDMQVDLLGSGEFYTQCNRDKTQYIERLFEVVLGRRPSRQELDGWLARLDQQNGLRRDLAREFLMAVSDQQ